MRVVQVSFLREGDGEKIVMVVNPAKPAGGGYITQQALSQTLKTSRTL